MTAQSLKRVQIKKMEILLKEGERIDDLERNGYRIIQNENGFCFGMDAVLLSGFIKAKKNDSFIDLGTGTGIIPILVRAKTECRDLTGLELQKDCCDMAARSVRLNGLEDDIKIVAGDICKAGEIFGKGSFDIAASNPPYIKAKAGLVNPASEKALARHEISCTFEDVAGQASLLLKPGGKFFLVHRPERLAEIIYTLKQYDLEPKRLKMVHSYIDSQACMFLLEASKGGNPAMRSEKPLIIYKDKNVYSDEIREIYGF